MRRAVLLIAALSAGMAASAMPLGLRTATWGVAQANRQAALEAAFPALDGEATSADVGAALDGATDERLAENITDADGYAAFRDWAKQAGAEEVKASGTAWLSYALGVAGIVPAPQEGDLVIDDVSVGDDGKLEAVFSLDGVEVGAAALEARLKTIFGVEGTTELGDSAFSDKGLSFNLQRTSDGKVKATVTPVGSPPSFFLRVKVK